MIRKPICVALKTITSLSGALRRVKVVMSNRGHNLNDVDWNFVSKQNRAAFIIEPEKFIPQLLIFVPWL